MENQRTFEEFHKRILQLEKRQLTIKGKWEIYHSISPILSLFKRRKFNRILRTIFEMKKAEYLKGCK